MAVEDGAALGTLLGLRQRSATPPSIQSVLKLYEESRKKRTALQLRGALQNRELFHLSEESQVQDRKEALQTLTWDGAQKDCAWLWADMEYQKELHGFDAIEAARKQFEVKFGCANTAPGGEGLENSQSP